MLLKYGKPVKAAIAVLLTLAKAQRADSARRMTAAEIAAAPGLPVPIVAKTLTILSRAGLVIGSPGPHGGYGLARPADRISVWDVLEASAGATGEHCPMGLDHCCFTTRCPMHAPLERARREVLRALKTTKLEDFAAVSGLDLGTTRKK